MKTLLCVCASENPLTHALNDIFMHRHKKKIIKIISKQPTAGSNEKSNPLLYKSA